MGDFMIKVDSASKVFRLPKEKNTSVKSAFISLIRPRHGYDLQKALDKVSFEVKEGEFFGIVGRNGSGKSTLLKLLAEIYSPSSGQVQVRGSLTPFIELGVGFNPELTGRENVYLNGALLGFNRREMNQMYKEIVDFAELGKFMDQKLKNYSSGMQVRLAFSIAIRAQSDILLIDEVLAVGDADFQKKCYNYFLELRRQKKTIVFVSHDMTIVRRFCSRCILIDDGRLIKEGSAEEVTDLYERINLKEAEKWLSARNPISHNRQGSQEATIEQVATYNVKTLKAQTTFSSDEEIGVRLIIKCHSDVNKPAIGFILQDESDVTIMATNNQILKMPTQDIKAGQQLKVECEIKNVFTNGEYTITAAVESNDFSEVYDRVEYIHRFLIDGHKLPHARVHPQQTMKLSYSKAV